MNDPAPTQNDASHNADDLLPPVQPPAATFIMQLFMIPLLIVSIIVGVWLLFSWIANMGTQPAELVNDIEYLNHASWQKALTLANTLRDPRNEELRSDPALADRVSSLLDRQLENDRTDRDNLWLQIYLCRVLGEFNIDHGLPTLLKAVERTDPVEAGEVRRSALQAIGLLVDRIGPEKALENKQLVPTLIAISNTPDTDKTDGTSPARLRSTSAFVLGLLDEPSARDRLVSLLDDSQSDVQFNAAIGLARQGDERSAAKLAQMLAPTNELLMAEMDATLPESEQLGWLSWKRDLIVGNALRAVEKLVTNADKFESDDLVDRVREIAKAGTVSEPIRAAAKKLVEVLENDTSNAT